VPKCFACDEEAVAVFTKIRKNIKIKDWMKFDVCERHNKLVSAKGLSYAYRDNSIAREYMLSTGWVESSKCGMKRPALDYEADFS
jgi:hypothetical protein